jgi:hypothetical protein
MIGLALFAAGMAWVDLSAGIDSTWLTFLPGLVVAGIGVGCTFAPMATVAMRNVRPQRAGAASGVLNTTRQVGGAIGSAVVGAVLQNRLSTSLHAQAVAYAGQLPSQVSQQARDQFVRAFSNSSGGLEVGTSSSSAAGQLAGLPPQVAEQIGRIAHLVFAHGFIDAMRPTLLVPVAALAIAALSCLAVRSQRRVQRLPAAAAGTAGANGSGPAAPHPAAPAPAPQAPPASSPAPRMPATRPGERRTTAH